MRKFIANEDFLMCNIRPELRSQVCVDRYSANLVHNGQFEFPASPCDRAVGFDNLMTYCFLA